MKIIAVCYYYDKQLGKHIRAGDAYEVSDKRGRELVNARLAGEVRTAPVQTAKIESPPAPPAPQTPAETQPPANAATVATPDKAARKPRAKKAAAKSGTDANK